MASMLARQHFEPGLAVRFLSELQNQEGVDAVATWPDDPAAYFVYFAGVGHLPAVLVALGLLVAVVSALNLCRPAPAPKTPDSQPLLLFGTLLLALTWLFAALAFRSGLQHYSAGASAVAQAQSSAEDTFGGLQVLNASVAALRPALGGLLGRCPELEELVQRALGDDSVAAAKRFEAMAETEMAGLQNSVIRLRPSVMAFSTLLGSAEYRVESVSKFVTYCFFAPVKLTIFCIIAFFALSLAHSAGGAFAETVESVGLGRIAGGLAFVVVLAAAGSGASLLGLGARGAAFCEHPASNSVGLARDAAAVMGAETLISSLARFYILGEGENSVLSDLLDARARTIAVSMLLRDNAELLTQLALFCDKLDAKSYNSSVATARGLLERDVAALSEGSMYGHYEQALPGSFCDASLRSLALLVALQMTLALLCLPLALGLARPWIGHGAGRDMVSPRSAGGFGRDLSRGGLESGVNGTLAGGRLERHAQMEAARLLGAEGSSASPSVGSRSGKSGLSEPWQPGDERRAGELLRRLLDSGAELSRITAGGRPILELAVSVGDLDFLRAANARGAQISGWDMTRAYGNSMVAGAGGEPSSLAAAVATTGFDNLPLEAQPAPLASAPGQGQPGQAFGSPPPSSQWGAPSGGSFEDPALATFVPRKGTEARSRSGSPDGRLASPGRSRGRSPERGRFDLPGGGH